MLPLCDAAAADLLAWAWQERMLAAITPAQLCEAGDELPDTGSGASAEALPSAEERAAYAALLRSSADATADAHPAPEAVFAALPPRASRKS